ncbi:MAG: hypothetical protein LDLANPLL_01150 [Turneriella sp.]|nr:hypothetical protein [Turneriella sp.]
MLKKLLALLLALTFIGGVVAQDAEATSEEAPASAPAKDDAKPAKKKKAKKAKKHKKKRKAKKAAAESAENGN